mmetsp:Transcript_61444/g.173277  ORF Transcript_61444/g.173277 Transcript_61444/m.173277 type:complete len:329 (-) Transcript_61444:105-1091(-)
MFVFSLVCCPQGRHVSHSRYVLQMLNSDDDGSSVPNFASSESTTLPASSGTSLPRMASRSWAIRDCFSSFSMPSSRVICFSCSARKCCFWSFATFSSTCCLSLDCRSANWQSRCRKPRIFSRRLRRSSSASTAWSSPRLASETPATRSVTFTGSSSSKYFATWSHCSLCRGDVFFSSLRRWRISSCRFLTRSLSAGTSGSLRYSADTAGSGWLGDGGDSTCTRRTRLFGSTTTWPPEMFGYCVTVMSCSTVPTSSRSDAPATRPASLRRFDSAAALVPPAAGGDSAARSAFLPGGSLVMNPARWSPPFFLSRAKRKSRTSCSSIWITW